MESIKLNKDQQKEFVEGLFKVCNREWVKIDQTQIIDRPIYITISTANYGKPSMVLIEWQGSPSICPILVNVDSESCKGIVNRKHWFNSYVKQERFKNFIVDFLKKYNYLS